MYDRIQKMRFELFVGFLIAGMGFFTFLMNLMTLLAGRTSFDSSFFAWMNLFTTLFLGIILFVFTWLARTRPYPYAKMSQYLQTGILILVSGLAILDTFEGSYGIALFILGILLAYKYNQLNAGRIILLVTYVILLTVAAAYHDQRLHASFLSILFYLFFFGILGFAYADTVRRADSRNDKLEGVIGELKQELYDREQISSRLTAIRLDVEDFSFTPAEKELLSLMCIEGKTSTKELADHLNKSPSTVKTQLYSIFEKTGIHKRSQLIAFFRE